MKYDAMLVTAICAALMATDVAAADAGPGELSPQELQRMSLDELMNINVTSVSKKSEPLSKAAAAVYVITNEDIRRSGATSIPEALRLAPNLQVARVSANSYAITARGFNSTTANKLLVMIDGRSVYTPLFSGVFWDVQDVMLEDVDRIEVISGPGGTLWGSNAVNGIINVIMRKSSDTQGGRVAVGGGNAEHGGAVRYGARVNDDTTFRVYGKGFERTNTTRSRGESARDAWDKAQGGFRVDGGKPSSKITFQGDVYSGTEDQLAADDIGLQGGNLLGRWDKTLDNGSTIQLQTYYDRTTRNQPRSFEEKLDTYDISMQYGFDWGEDQQFVWGGGYRYSRDDVTNSVGLAFLPPQRNLGLANIYIQDTIKLSDSLDLTLGGKLEHNSYTGLEVLWNTRLAWELSDQDLLWSSISRAVRTPSRLDKELFAPGKAPFILLGGPGFESETLIAYEIGYRAQPSPRITYSVSTYYNDYDKLRSLEPTGAGAFPVVIANKMGGSAFGVETWGSVRALDWWTLKLGFNVMNENLKMDADSRDSAGTSGAGNDPHYQVSLQSMMNLPHDVDVDFGVRSIGSLPKPDVSEYTALDVRLGWHATEDVEISLAGFNLLDNRHPEFGSFPTRSEIGRSVYLKLQWDFP